MYFDHILPKNIHIVYDRQEFIADLCKEKNVLHLGCVDSGLTKEAIMKGNFLQSKIEKVANIVIGVDCDLKGLEFLEQHKSSKERFLNLNIENLIINEIEEDVDIIIAGEILEHLSSPGIFLKNIQSFMRSKNARMLLTVPNASSLRHMFGIWDGNEYVHPDHNFYFSYFTINHFCNKFNLNIDEVYTYVVQPKIIRGKSLIPLRQITRKIFCDYMIRKTPFFADGLIFHLTTE